MQPANYLPCDILKPYIARYVITESDDENPYKVLPGTSLVIGFQYKGQLSLQQNGSARRLSSSGITGLQDRYRVFINSRDTGSVLVYFREGGAAAFFKQPLHELFNESLALSDLILQSELLVLEDALLEAKTDSGRIEVVEKFLISRIRNLEADKLVMAAIAHIHRHAGNIRIRELMDHLNISQSPLEKRFRQAVGTSPKKFVSIVKFRHTLQQLGADASLTALGLESGYYDQSHFIKAFKTFTGETPESFFLPRHIKD